MQILTIRKDSKHSKRFKAFECKFEPFEPNSKYLNATSNHSKGIQSIEMQTRTLWMRFEAFESIFKDSNHSNGNSKYIFERYSKEIWNIQMQFLEMDSKYSNANLNPSNEIWSIQLYIQRDSHHSSANFNYLNEIRNVWMQILAIRKGFEAFESKF